MFKISTVILLAGSIVASLHASPIVSISYQVTPVGNLERYNYFLTVTNGPLTSNLELDIQFNANTTGVLSNGVAPSGFNLLLLQPNQPPQAPGYYSLLTTTNNPSLAGPFSVDFTYTGVGTPGPQQFFLYDDNVNNFGALLQSGTTVPIAGGGVPEPSTWLLGSIGLSITGAFVGVRRKIFHAVHS